MKRKLLSAFLVASLLAIGTINAQDTGVTDTLEMIVIVAPDAQTSQLELQLELYAFNDEQLAAASSGFSWDNPNLQLDSAVATSLTATGFAIGPFFYENNDIAQTNANQRFLFGGVSITGFPADASGRRLWATYYFTLSSWSETDVINIDTLFFNDASIFQFVSLNQVPFQPVWTGGLKIKDANAPANLELSETQLFYNSIEGGPAPPTQEFEITGDGVDFSMSEDAGWINVSPLSGIAPRTIMVSINNVGLTAGSYFDTITVNSSTAGNTPLYVEVSLEVTPPPPSIGVSPSVFFFNAIANEANPDPKVLTISNTGGSTLNWSVSNTEPWLSLNPPSGVNTGDVTLSVDITGLSFGTYVDTVVASDPAATNDPVKIPVTLSVASDLPIIEVDSVFNFVLVPGGVFQIDPGEITVRNGAGGSLGFWLEEDSPRLLSVDPESGVAPQVVQVNYKVNQGSSGDDYFDTLWVFSNEAINSPFPVVFQFHFVDNPAEIHLSHDTLDLNVYECSQGFFGELPTEFFTVHNIGYDNPMPFVVDWESDLFNIEFDFGVASQNIYLTANDVQLPLGSYYDTVVVYAQKAVNTPQSLIVRLNMIEADQPQEIYLPTWEFTINSQEDHGPVFGSVFETWGRYGGCMDWQIDEDIPWLMPTDTVGTAPSTTGLLANATGFTFGTYLDTFFITSAEAVNSPFPVEMTLNVWRYYGDVNYDSYVNIMDLTYMVDWIFRSSGLEPQPERITGDCNCNGRADIEDLTYLVDYIFRLGPFPCGNPMR